MNPLTAQVMRPRSRALGAVAFLAATCIAVTASPAVSYTVQGLTAFTAAVVLLVAARRRDALTRSRRLLAIALLVGALSGVAASVHAVVTGAVDDPGGPYDLLGLAGIPVAVAGLLALPGSAGGRVRTMADGAVAAGSIWFITVWFLNTPADLDVGLSTVARLTTLGYVLLPAFVLSVLLSVAPRSAPQVRPFLLRVGLGMAAVSVSDLLFAVQKWQGNYQPTGAIAMISQVGAALLLFAALTPVRPVAAPSRDRVRAEQRAGSREAALPYVPLVAALLVAGAQWIGGDPFSHAQNLPVLMVGTAVVVRHAATVRDYRRLVARLEESEREARAQALRDPLTGLANRTAFIEALRQVLGDPGAHPVGVALLDLNDFKEVNDSHGHETGDRLLQGCADRLLTVAPPGGLVARLGGDEFALFQPRADIDGASLVAAVTTQRSPPPSRSTSAASPYAPASGSWSWSTSGARDAPATTTRGPYSPMPTWPCTRRRPPRIGTRSPWWCSPARPGRGPPR